LARQPSSILLVFPAEDVEIEDQFTTHTYALRDGLVIYSSATIISSMEFDVLFSSGRISE
jgi:hypothetical protein